VAPAKKTFLSKFGDKVSVNKIELKELIAVKPCPKSSHSSYILRNKLLSK
jgi:hypothetical protein